MADSKVFDVKFHFSMSKSPWGQVLSRFHWIGDGFIRGQFFKNSFFVIRSWGHYILLKKLPQKKYIFKKIPRKTSRKFPRNLFKQKLFLKNRPLMKPSPMLPNRLKTCPLGDVDMLKWNLTSKTFDSATQTSKLRKSTSRKLIF